jgi:hypothetical protein
VVPEIRYSDGSVRKGENLPPGVLPVLELAGSELTFVRIDHAVRLTWRFGSRRRSLSKPQATSGYSIPRERSELGPLLVIFPGNLANAGADGDLKLHLDFEGGTRLTIPQHPRYESWHIIGPGSREMHCPPAGDGTVALFD